MEAKKVTITDIKPIYTTRTNSAYAFTSDGGYINVYRIGEVSTVYYEMCTGKIVGIGHKIPKGINIIYK